MRFTFAILLFATTIAAAPVDTARLVASARIAPATNAGSLGKKWWGSHPTDLPGPFNEVRIGID